MTRFQNKMKFVVPLATNIHIKTEFSFSFFFVYFLTFQTRRSCKTKNLSFISPPFFSHQFFFLYFPCIVCGYKRENTSLKKKIPVFPNFFQSTKRNIGLKILFLSFSFFPVPEQPKTQDTPKLFSPFRFQVFSSSKRIQCISSTFLFYHFLSNQTRYDAITKRHKHIPKIHSLRRSNLNGRSNKENPRRRKSNHIVKSAILNIYNLQNITRPCSENGRLCDNE